jgi:hypothetical protein
MQSKLCLLYGIPYALQRLLQYKIYIELRVYKINAEWMPLLGYEGDV